MDVTTERFCENMLPKRLLKASNLCEDVIVPSVRQSGIKRKLHDYNSVHVDISCKVQTIKSAVCYAQLYNVCAVYPQGRPLLHIQ